MATRERRYGPGGGITLGGIIVIVGIVLMFVWSFWIGLIIALVGLVAFGGVHAGQVVLAGREGVGGNHAAARSRAGDACAD
jgi:hypothetical protein